MGGLIKGVSPSGEWLSPLMIDADKWREERGLEAEALKVLIRCATSFLDRVLASQLQGSLANS